MEVSDGFLIYNRDWDPSYLSEIVQQDFYDFPNLWGDSSVQDSDLVNEMERVERYQPIVEDISIEDDILCSAVEKIEKE